MKNKIEAICTWGDGPDVLLKCSDDPKDFYDLIVLNTCPLIWMDYDLINKILNKKGKMIFTTFNGRPNEKYFNDDSIEMYKSNFKSHKINIDDYFKQEEGSEPFVFIKK